MYYYLYISTFPDSFLQPHHVVHFCLKKKHLLYLNWKTSYVKQRASVSQAALYNVTEFSGCFIFKVKIVTSVFIVACVVLFVKMNCNWTQL
jgi:hypothetical protein